MIIKEISIILNMDFPNFKIYKKLGYKKFQNKYHED